MKNIEKVLIFTHNGNMINGVQKINDCHFTKHLTPGSNDRNIKIDGNFTIPEEYDYLYFIERPSDEEELIRLRNASVFKPLVYGLGDASINLAIDSYYVRYRFAGLKLNDSNEGTYGHYLVEYW